MRSKKEILKDIGGTEEYNPRAGILPDTKDVILIEVFIDIRDILAADMETSMQISKAMKKRH